MKIAHLDKPVLAHRRLHNAVVLLMGMVVSHAAHAAGQDIQRGIGAAAGVFAGIYVHELGHAAAFRAAGADEIRIRVPGPQCALLCGQTDAKWRGALSPATVRGIGGAGFLASNLAAEVLLRHDAAARSGFGQGFVATNLYSNVVHVAIYYTRVRGRNGYRGNDIDTFEMAGGNPHLLSAGLLAYSLYTVQRARKKGIPIVFLGGHF
jgi:hypothetical protein